MSRIDKTFIQLKQEKKKAFIAFITAGDPSLRKTEELVVAFEKAGVDIVELGVPFSDPLADGPTIQASSQRALRHGVNLEKILNVVSRIRKKSEIPIALMTYYNPVYHYGEQRFLKHAKKCGVDGIIIPDLPPEEATNIKRIADEQGISLVFFAAPTTTSSRLKIIKAASSGFVYYVSLTGVTGAREQLASAVKQQIQKVKKSVKKPVCVGFGISTAQQVKSLASVAEGVIVGSAIVKCIHQHAQDKNMTAKVARFVKQLSAGLSA